MRDSRSLSQDHDAEDSADESVIDVANQSTSAAATPGKPGRKKNPNSQAARRDQNRIAQREFRLRKQQRIRDLEARVEILSGSQDQTFSELKAILRDLMAENHTLRALIRSLSTFIGDGLGGVLPCLGFERHTDFMEFINKAETDTAFEGYRRRKSLATGGGSGSSSGMGGGGLDDDGSGLNGGPGTGLGGGSAVGGTLNALGGLGLGNFAKGIANVGHHAHSHGLSAGFTAGGKRGIEDPDDLDVDLGNLGARRASGGGKRQRTLGSLEIDLTGADLGVGPLQRSSEGYFSTSARSVTDASLFGDLMGGATSSSAAGTGANVNINGGQQQGSNQASGLNRTTSPASSGSRPHTGEGNGNNNNGSNGNPNGNSGSPFTPTYSSPLGLGPLGSIGFGHGHGHHQQHVSHHQPHHQQQLSHHQQQHSHSHSHSPHSHLGHGLSGLGALGSLAGLAGLGTGPSTSGSGPNGGANGANGSVGIGLPGGLGGIGVGMAGLGGLGVGGPSSIPVNMQSALRSSSSSGGSGSPVGGLSANTTSSNNNNSNGSGNANGGANGESPSSGVGGIHLGPNTSSTPNSNPNPNNSSGDNNTTTNNNKNNPNGTSTNDGGLGGIVDSPIDALLDGGLSGGVDDDEHEEFDQDPKLDEAMRLIHYHLENYRRNNQYCLPQSLRPTSVQRQMAHEGLIDGIPHPELRDRMIVMRGRYNLVDFLHDFRRSLTLHGDDVLAHANYELSEKFLFKYGILIDQAVLNACNRWRRERGERELTMGEINPTGEA